MVPPEGLETIGFRAFESCANLPQIHFPPTLKTIEHNVFTGCTGLQRAPLPESLETIGDRAFEDCWHLESVNFPQGLKSIGARAFANCSALTEIILPQGLEFLGDGAFTRCISAKQIHIAPGLKKIPTWAFQNCEDLESVTLPQGLEDIEGGAFAWCGNLKELNLPRTVHTIGARAFSECISFPVTVTLPHALNKMGAEAFARCPIQSFSMSPVTFAALSYRNFPGGNAGVAVETENGWRFYAFAAKATGDNLGDFFFRDKLNTYDLELINNGPVYKYKAPARLLGTLGRIVDPVDLTEECRELHMEYLVKNAKKLVPLAESLSCPAIIEAMKQHGIINDKNKKAMAKLLAASAVPEIAAISL